MSDAREAPLVDIDPELNIFALANGLDLLRNVSEVPDRVLEWYRDGMERRILIRAGDAGHCSVAVGASRKKDGVRREAERSLREPMGSEPLNSELRTILAEGIEAANEIGMDDLEPSES